MTNNTIQSIRIKLKPCCMAFFSLLILTQCARDDSKISQRQAAPQQQRAYPAQQYYQAPQNSPYYGAPNSQAYSNPYDFQPPYGQSPNSDNDTTYVLPSEYYLR